jgi:hypothetical protein
MDSSRRHIPVADQRRLDFVLTKNFSPKAIRFPLSKLKHSTGSATAVFWVPMPPLPIIEAIYSWRVQARGDPVIDHPTL